MKHDDITDIAALVDEQRHRLATWPELVAALEQAQRDGGTCLHLSGDTLETIRRALFRAKSPPAPEDRHQLYAPSVDRRSVEDLHE